MNATTHPIAPEEVMAFVDGELPGVWNDFVAGHIAECDECRQAVTEFRNGSERLGAWQVETVPSRVEEKIRAGSSLAQSKSGKGGIARWLGVHASFGAKWALGLGIAAVVLLLVIQRSKNEPRDTGVATKQMTAFKHQSAWGFPANPGREQAPAPQKQVLELNDQQSQVFSNQITALASPAVPADSNGLSHGMGDQVQDVFSVSPAPMIARTVSLSIVAKDLAAARATLDTILVRHHSYAAELTVNTAEGTPRTFGASLRVPAQELAPTLSELKSLGRVERETQSGEEVTEQHADLGARLKNSRETEQRLQAILEQRTGKISDVLEVEREITRVRGEIEQREAQQKSLEHRVDFATVNLNLADIYFAELTVPPSSMGARLHNGFVTGFHNASETLLAIVLFFAEDGPTLLVWLILLGLPVLFVWRRYRRSRATV